MTLETTEIRDNAKGVKSVDASTVSGDIRLLLATPVGQRDEHISTEDIAFILGITSNTAAVAQHEADLEGTYVLATQDW